MKKKKKERLVSLGSGEVYYGSLLVAAGPYLAAEGAEAKTFQNLLVALPIYLFMHYFFFHLLSQQASIYLVLLLPSCFSRV